MGPASRPSTTSSSASATSSIVHAGPSNASSSRTSLISGRGRSRHPAGSYFLSGKLLELGLSSANSSKSSSFTSLISHALRQADVMGIEASGSGVLMPQTLRKAHIEGFRMSHADGEAVLVPCPMGTHLSLFKVKGEVFSAASEEQAGTLQTAAGKWSRAVPVELRYDDQLEPSREMGWVLVGDDYDTLEGI